MVSPLVPVTPNPHDLAELSSEERRLIERMEQAGKLLAEANDDFTRMRIRSEAAAVAAAAAVLGLSEVQITASHLVCRAERAIALANEPVVQEILTRTGIQRQRRFPAGSGDNFPESYPGGNEESYRKFINNVRNAHINLTDDEFEEACAASARNGTPLSRHILYELTQTLKRQSYPTDPPAPVVQPPLEESSPAEIQERLQTAEERRQQAEAELARERERANRLEQESEEWRKFQGEKNGYGNMPEWRETFTDEDSLNKADALRAAQAQAEETEPEPETEIDRSRHLEQGTGNNERYTPAYIIQAARQVIGDIELDPASSDAANCIIQARRYYTAERDGLAQDWTAESLWMNPPYSRGDIDAFVEKLAAEVKRGAVKRAVVITHNATETRWCRALLDNCAAFCLLKERVDFSTPGEQGAGTLRGQIVFLLGDTVRSVQQEGKADWDWVQRFNLAFSELGEVCIPVAALNSRGGGYAP